MRRLRAAGRSRDARVIVPALLAAAAAVAGSVLMADSLTWAPIIPLALVGAILAAWLVLAAACGSPTAIMIYFAALVFLINAQFRVREAGDISGDWQSALKFLIWMGAGVIGAPHLPPLSALLRRPASALWLIYIALALLSSLYSPAAGYSFGCALALLCLFAFAFALVRRVSPAQILWTVGLSLTLFNAVGWVVFFADPELGVSAAFTNSGIMMRMCGLAGQATNLGAVCALGVGVMFVLWYEKRCGALAALLLGGFAFVTLLKSDARTTEIATILGIALVFASRSNKLVIGASLACVSGVLLLQVFPSIPAALSASFSRSGDPTEIYTGNGRLQIWDFAWEQICASPILGYGYNSAKVVLGSHVGFSNGLMVDNAHNLYLQNLLSIGVLGTAPLVGLLLTLIWRCCTRPVPIVLYVLVAVLVSSISDTDAIGTTPTLMTVMLFVVSIWPNTPRPQRSAALAMPPAWVAAA